MPTPKAAPRKNGDTHWIVRYRDAAGNARHRTFLENDDAGWFCDQIEHRGPSLDEKQLRDVEREAERAGERASTPALDKVAADFFRWKRAYVRAGETVDAYERHYANHIQPTLGAHPIGTINSYDVDDWVEAMVVGTIKNSRTGKGLSPKTIAARHALLHSIMEYAASRAGASSTSTRARARRSLEAGAADAEGVAAGAVAGLERQPARGG
ncbi:hypothetical protein H7F30_11465 [Dermacoccus sp. PAMC28757]|uniref:hypothetical protein n=1 Tax=Dermacoccus sp. PAMC28757 TaxID=2762331 RepID=UPI00164DDEF2|nr:hypothetical protein [Dermacoccus sp. PAMC28757]QNK52224.1 hypothetical protein H7F30_11465 [Dermacoccus sp. PAMC28757]